MQPTLCSRCKKNVAVVFISRMNEKNEMVNEGLCLKCAAQLGLPEKLEAAGCTVYARGRSWDRKDTDKGVTAPVYISSANGVAETGELVNIDGTGNRVAATLYGPEKVYFIVGLNKLAPTLEAAIDRARNVAAPKNAQRLGTRTPCAADGKCHDCKSPARICRALVVHMGAPKGFEKCEIVLVGESLGY